MENFTRINKIKTFSGKKESERRPLEFKPLTVDDGHSSFVT